MDESVLGSNYQPLHHFISHSPWDGQAVINEVAEQTQATFQARPGRVGLLLDESGWAKASHHSVGVARQYIGQLGKVDNGQVGVFAALCQEDRVGLVGARLYLPAEWTDDPARCAAAGIPKAAQEYRSKPELAAAIIAQLEDKVTYEWVGGDALYGNSPFCGSSCALARRAMCWMWGSSWECIWSRPRRIRQCGKQSAGVRRGAG